MFSCHVSCHAWDLLDEGLDHTMDRLQNVVGAGGLTVPMIGDELEQFRPHLGVEPKIYRTAGGVFFQSQAASYEATRLTPPQWDQHRKADPLARISQRCAERRLDLRVTIQPFHSRRLVAKHQEIACKNAYDVSSRSALCPTNPDVRHYLQALIRDLGVYDVSAIVLEEVARPAATDPLPDMDAMALLGQKASALLRLCFCESCLQMSEQAGVDGAAAKRRARGLVDDLCRYSRRSEAVLEELLEKEQLLQRFVAWSDDSFVDLLLQMKKAAAPGLFLSFQNAEHTFLEVRKAADLLRLADRILVDLDDLEQAIGQLSQGQALQGTLTPDFVRRAELLLRVDEGVIDTAPEVVRQMTWAAEAGAAGVTVTHYGVILEDQFEWINRGLRNARRVAET